MPADPQSLADALERLGVACDVEVEGALAILVPRADASFPAAELRGEVVRVARAAGFGSIAFELHEARPTTPSPAA